ncbi:MAG: PPOX class F420-dependent oxidoreductase [Chloroflexia bacterium]|nr:PPOX class F420-dependent oxidoreductase [Chloroflexia bacterium]
MSMILSETARRFLNEPRFATLATINPNGSVQQTVMWYLVRGDMIVMNTARGRKKDRNLLRDRRVSICVEDGYRYVTIAGEVALVEDQAMAQRDIAELAERYHGAAQAAQMVRDQFSQQERVSLVLSISRVDERGLDGKE